MAIHLKPSALVSVGLLALPACSAPSDHLDVRLAELVPVAAQGLSTEIILPPYRQSLDLLDEGWEEATAVQAREQGLWIVGTAGSFRFFSAVGGPTLLEVEATALASPDMPQVMQLEVNERTVHREAMPRQWKRYEFSLSAQDVRLGWNVVTMRFRHALRPRDLDSASGDVRLLAARFRRLRIRSSFGRTLWADGPSAIEVTPVAADRSDVSTILMPTDSALDFYLLPEHGAILTGSVDAVVADRSLGGGHLGFAGACRGVWSRPPVARV